MTYGLELLAAASTESPRTPLPDEPVSTELCDSVVKSTAREIIDPPSEGWRNIAEALGWEPRQFERDWANTPAGLKQEVWNEFFARSDSPVATPPPQPPGGLVAGFLSLLASPDAEDASPGGFSCLPVT